MVCQYLLTTMTGSPPTASSAPTTAGPTGWTGASPRPGGCAVSSSSGERASYPPNLLLTPAECRAKDYGLKPIQVAELGPLVFINLDSEADTEEFREDFREVEARLLERNLMVGTLLQLHSATAGLQDMRWVRRVEYPMNCNWKIFVDNYLDGG